MLEVELHDEYPVVKSYHHKPSGEEIGGDLRNSNLLVNGRPAPWDQWRIDASRSETGSSIRYEMTYADISLVWAIELSENMLTLRIDDIEGPLETLGFGSSPLISISDPDYYYARVTTTGPDEMGKRWWREEVDPIGRNAEDSSRDVIRGCVYHPEKLCVFPFSNYPLFPERHEYSNGSYRISLSDYRYAVRSTVMWPLEVSVVFLEDLNGDGIINWSDFALWINRRLPDADEIYRTSLAYKVIMTLADDVVSTTFDETGEIARALYNVTDGLPQLIYLVGWQFDGHDDKYPSIDKIGTKVGGAHKLQTLVDDCSSKYNALLSYHINIDDAYRDSPDWDPSYMSEHGVVHTLDWENEHFVRRMGAMFDICPVAGSLHVDNTRFFNTYGNPMGEIAELEELYCGLLPMVEWLSERGISLTTEGSNGMPIDGTLVFDGYWHHDVGMIGRQMLHRKIVGGGHGMHWGTMTALDCGVGSSIHVDFCYHPKQFCVDLERNFVGMVRRIYLGTMLYLYFLERELTVCRIRGPESFYMEYDDGTVADITSRHSMRVTKGDMVIAIDNDDRCIPLHGALYLYSEVGGVKTFPLPEELRGRKVRVVALTPTGTEVYDRHLKTEQHYSLFDDRIEFTWMAPYVPFKLSSI